jgi:hypothetical protein
VNKPEVATEIKERKKAEIYFGFLQSLINDPFNLPKPDRDSQRYIKKLKWFTNHPRIHYAIVKTIKTKDLFTNRFLKAFVSKTVFKNLVVRITNPGWWQKRLFKGLKKYFS